MCDDSRLSFVDWSKRIKLINSGHTDIKLADERHKKEIQRFFAVKQANVFNDTLTLMETMYDDSRFNPKFGSIGVKFMILSELNQFVKKNPTLKAPLTLRTQMRALEYVIAKKNRSWIEQAFGAYKLSEVSEDEMNKVVDRLIAEKSYADAANVVVQRKLQTKRDLKDIVIPLLLEDKVNVLEYYIESCPETASKLISYLDSVKNSYDIVESLAEGTMVDVSKVKAERFAPKTFNKLITRLMKKYNITADCPVTTRETKFRAIKFLVFKRCREVSISEDCFREGLYKTVEECKELINDVVDHLISYKAIDEAVKFCDYFNVHESDRPSELIFRQESTIQKKSYASSSWDPDYNDSWNTASNNNKYYDDYDDDDDECDIDYRKAVFASLTSKNEPGVEYLGLRLNNADVHFVNTVKDFEEAIESILCYDVIGIDCEWKPMLGAVNVSSVQMVEIMQIATWDDCFLIDVQQVKDSESQWTRVCNHIFNSPKILKIGFGIKSDWANIKATLPKNVFTQTQNVLDFSDFSEWLFLKYPDIVDKNKNLLNSKDAKGLSKLTYLVLGKFINKEEQFSDWGRRPLRENQIKYAAIDAYSLLQVYEQLFENLSKMGINFQEVIENYVAGKISAEEKLSLKSEFALNTIENIEFPVTAIRHFKCIADTMVQGLGKNLRICGADVWILEGNEYDQEVSEYSDQENALMLTTGHRFDYWRNKVNPGKCCRVANTLTAHEQMKVIIKRFNLRITEKDLLSRCVKCNSDEFEEIPSSVLRTLYLLRKKTYRNIPLKFEGLQISKFDSISIFWICVQCGQIYWEGCHHNRLKRKVQELLFPHENEEVKGVKDSPGKKIVVHEVITIDDD